MREAQLNRFSALHCLGNARPGKMAAASGEAVASCANIREHHFQDVLHEVANADRPLAFTAFCLSFLSLALSLSRSLSLPLSAHSPSCTAHARCQTPLLPVVLVLIKPV